jgi:predicted RNA-binding Zn ribbon-like protein
VSIEETSLLGGHIVLDFMNTVGDHLSTQPSEGLHSYADLALWAGHAGVITREHGARLIELSREQADAAEDALLRATHTRDVIYRLLMSVIWKQPPFETDMVAFNQLLKTAPTRTHIIHADDRYEWRFSSEIESLDDVLWRLVWAAADLLTSDRLAQVKVCENGECGWMFLDTSRNQARRWCSMADCGNRAKAKRHYERHKGE